MQFVCEAAAKGLNCYRLMRPLLSRNISIFNVNCLGRR